MTTLAARIHEQAVDLPRSRPATGRDALSALFAVAHGVFDDLQRGARRGETPRGAFVGSVRGTGPGVSLSEIIAALERDHPIEPVFPFEGSRRVGGSAWRGSEIISRRSEDAALKLEWLAGADDLPMHTHALSDRFIVVLRGRGYFHVSAEEPEHFSAGSTRTLAVRERDVLAFTRGIVHTFSTAAEPMTLLSVHVPFIELDDTNQYTLPRERWEARHHLRPAASRVTAGRWHALL